MESLKASGYTDSELPVCVRATRLTIVQHVLIVMPAAIGSIGFGVFILLGHDPHKILAFLGFCAFGLAFLLLSATAISTRVQLTPTTIQYRNFFRNKTLAISDVVKVIKVATGNGPMLRIRSRNDYILLGYLTFSKAQILKIEGFLNDRLTSSAESAGRMQVGKPQRPGLKLPFSYFILQIAGAILLLAVLAYIRGGAVRDKLISIFPFLTNQEWVWAALVVGLVFVGFAQKTFFAAVRRRQARS